jgi:hypothetical protein
MILFRPTGLAEIRLVRDADWRCWPPRLPEQPIFYPVLNFEYAEQIARDWNSIDRSNNFLGFVTRFELAEDFARRYEMQIVGAAAKHQELWIPAEDVAEMNANMVGTIEVVAAYRNRERLAAITEDLLIS